MSYAILGGGLIVPEADVGELGNAMLRARDKSP